MDDPKRARGRKRRKQPRKDLRRGLTDPQTTEEAPEERSLAKGNAVQGDPHRTQGRRARGKTGLERIGDQVRRQAETGEKRKLTNLFNHLRVDLMREVFYRLKRKAAPGVDGQTWEDYAEGLEDRLVALQDRLHRGSYRPPPVRRQYIPKADGRMRPLGIPAIEDKVVQGAVVALLTKIYEAELLDCSYGFRPHHNQHQALGAVDRMMYREYVNWVLDADIKAYLHPTKTRLLRFGKFARRDCEKDGRERPETFDFLGFTHISGEAPRGGFKLIRRTTRKKRMAKMASLSQDMRKRMHWRIYYQWRWLCSVLKGHYNYYGVPTNYAALRSIQRWVRRRWHQLLQRRSQKAKLTRRQLDQLDRRYPLPKPRIRPLQPQLQLALAPSTRGRSRMSYVVSPLML